MMDVEGEGLYPEHFGVEGNKYIFMSMQYLYSKDVKPSPLAIMEVLSSESAKSAVESLGGLEYLTILAESNIDEDALPFFIGKVQQSFTRRYMYKICNEYLRFITSDKADVLNPQEIVGELEVKISNMVDGTSKSDVYKMGDDTQRVLKERGENPSVVPGLEVGWSEYDTLSNGAQGGDLIVVCAESKTGKSVTLTNWGTKLAIQDKIPILYIDTEMSSRQQEDRILANLSGIPHTEILNGMYVMDTKNGTKEDKLMRLNKAREMLSNGSYYHEYMTNFNIEKVFALTRKYQRLFGVAALFFDYIKIPSSQASGAMQMYQKLTFFTSGLKDLAGELNIPVFAAAQANRDELGNTEKDAKSLGGSYGILQLATKLMFLTNKSEEQIAKQGFANGNQVLSLKYQRNGEGDCPPINIMYHKSILRQEEV